MANTNLSDLGGSIFVDGYDGESTITLLADGTAKAGSLVGQTSGSGTMRGVDLDGNLDEFDGILVERYDTDLDSAPTAGKACTVVRPKAGRKYRVQMADQGAAKYQGEPMTFSNTAGIITAAGDAESAHVCRLSKDIADDDTVCEVVWGA